MRKLLKILSIIILVLFLISLTGYLYITNFGSRDLLTGAPTKVRLEVPITYNIGWWASQDFLTINSLDINIEESRLNLFNSKSLISYRIMGDIKYCHWLLEIKEVHISERINRDTTLNYDRVIELTPIVERIEYKKDNTREILKFEFKNEHIITSNHWGINRIKFICGDKEQIIELRQSK